MVPSTENDLIDPSTLDRKIRRPSGEKISPVKLSWPWVSGFRRCVETGSSVPVAEGFRVPHVDAGYPALGDANGLLKK